MRSPEGDPEGGSERGAEGGSRVCLHPTVRLLERFQIKTLTRKDCSRVCWAPCPDKNVQGEEQERRAGKRANGTAEPGIQWHALVWTVQLR